MDPIIAAKAIGELAQGIQPLVSAGLARMNTSDMIEANEKNLNTRIAADFGLEQKRELFQGFLEDKREKFQDHLADKQHSVQDYLQQRQHKHDSLNQQLRFLQQYLLQEDQQEHQERMVKLAAKYQRKLEIMRQEYEDKRLEKRMKFEEFLFEKRKELERELKQFERETQVLLSLLTLRNMQQNADYQRLHDVYPLVVPFSVTLDYYAKQQTLDKPLSPLLILAPPAVEFEKAPHAAQGFARLETRLTDCVRDFFSAHYPLQHPSTPVKFLGNAYKTKSIRGEAAVEILFNTHQAVPTLLLESQADGDAIKLYVAWWEIGDASPEYKKFLTINWRDVSGLTGKESGNSEDATAGMQSLAEFLGFCENVLASLFIDRYYLKQYQVTPQLPGLLPELLPAAHDQHTEQLVAAIAAHYTAMYQELEPTMPTLLPDIAIAVAASLAQIGYETAARQQFDYSARQWLRVRNAAAPSDDSLEALLTALETILNDCDLPYIEQVNRCLSLLHERPITLDNAHRRAKMEREQQLLQEIEQLKQQMQERETELQAEIQQLKENQGNAKSSLWDYKSNFIVVNVSRLNELDERINYFTKDGWELDKIRPFSKNNMGLLMIFKRPKEKNDAPQRVDSRNAERPINHPRTPRRIAVLRADSTPDKEDVFE